MHAALQYAVGVILVALWSFRQDFPPEYQRYIYDAMQFLGMILCLLTDPNAFMATVEGLVGNAAKRPPNATVAQVETHTNVVTTTPVVVPAPTQAPAPVAAKESATIVRSRPLWFPRLRT